MKHLLFRLFIVSLLVFVATPEVMARDSLMVTYKVNFRPLKSSNRRQIAAAYLIITDNRSVFIDQVLFNRLRIGELPISESEKNSELLKLDKIMPDLEYTIQKEPENNQLIYIEEHLPGNYIAFKVKLMEQEACHFGYYHGGWLAFL